MINGRRVLALVPARAGSKGLPGKNIRPLHGKPLLAWPVCAARGSRYVDRTVISTDDAGYAAIAVEHGAEAPFLRPAALASDTAASIDFILHALDTLEAVGDAYDYLVLLEPTSPMTEASDVDAALEQLVAANTSAEAIVGVTPLETSHPAFAVRRDQDGTIRPLLSDSFAALPRRQDLDPVFALDGSLYISSVAALRRTRSFAHEHTLGYVTDRFKALEIDDLVDFVCIEALMAHRLREAQA
ncbi:MAG: acylneuraminate cytidylyltransferase family protein [Sphingomonas sp.]|uniref:acylneuraminate cytidylyltransferase family protein n=1 Tax=Sphingomonas sp. TaxID=28214 RepID=UPI0025D7830F|nr:acylneuraminate cytidylyltransferase family protein [Sphingomonas sp.]MBX9881070.1 acylneuraminate cytidylyltransferase family protein [Sphingomonas sp.]